MFDACFIFPVNGAALISTTGKTEGNIERIKRGVCVLKVCTLLLNMKYYVHLKQLYEPGFESFPTLELTS